MNMNSARVLLCVAGILAVCVSTHAQGYSYSDWEQAVTDGADYLLQFQLDDGGFPWRLDEEGRTNFDPSAQSPANTLGATARGLVAAYQATGNGGFLDAANDVATLIEYRYDNDVSIGSYGPPFYNKDVEFAHELANAGGTDITAKANQSAIDYFNEKLGDYSGDPNVDTPAKAVYQRYIDSGWATPGAQVWMLGNWTHCGALLGSQEITAGYTGQDFANPHYS